MWNLKRNDTNELSYKTKILTDLENKLMVAECVWRGGIVKDLGKVVCTLLYLKWITDKNLLYSTWNSAQS